PVGRGRVLLETSLQDFHMALEVSELGQIVLHREQIRLDRGRGLLPVLVRKGKRPGGAVRGSGLIHSVTKLRPGGAIRTLFIAEIWTGVEQKMRAMPTEKLSVRVAASEGSLGASTEHCTGCVPVIAYRIVMQHSDHRIGC